MIARLETKAIPAPTSTAETIACVLPSTRRGVNRRMSKPASSSSASRLFCVPEVGSRKIKGSPSSSVKDICLLLASGLRESYEEMRLNPLGVKFLGPLPLQQLAMFRRDIYPLVCWVPRQKRFTLNWEVEKLVYIPLKDLLDPKNYACYRLSSEIPRKHWNNSTESDFPCFVQDSERLWGATFRITMTFLEIVFGFTPPEMSSLPVIYGKLGRNYATGNQT